MDSEEGKAAANSINADPSLALDESTNDVSATEDIQATTLNTATEDSEGVTKDAGGGHDHQQNVARANDSGSERPKDRVADSLVQHAHQHQPNANAGHDSESPSKTPNAFAAVTLEDMATVAVAAAEVAIQNGTSAASTYDNKPVAATTEHSTLAASSCPAAVTTPTAAAAAAYQPLPIVVPNAPLPGQEQHEHEPNSVFDPRSHPAQHQALSTATTAHAHASVQHQPPESEGNMIQTSQIKTGPATGTSHDVATTVTTTVNNTGTLPNNQSKAQASAGLPPPPPNTILVGNVHVLQTPPKKKRRGYGTSGNQNPTFNDHLFELMVFKCKYGHCRVPKYTHKGLKSLSKWVSQVRDHCAEMQTDSVALQQQPAQSAAQNGAIANANGMQNPQDQAHIQQYHVDGQMQANLLHDPHAHDLYPHGLPGPIVTLPIAAFQSGTDANGDSTPNVAAGTKRKHSQDQSEKQSQDPQQTGNKPLDPPIHPSVFISPEIASQRSAANYLLTSERLDVLNSVGFCWDRVPFDGQSRWNSHFQLLQEYKRENGHTNVPQSSGKLGLWVKSQREQYREYQLKKKGRNMNHRKHVYRTALSLERLEKLNSIGFEWRTAPPVAGWNTRFEELVAYLQETGTTNVPVNYPKNKALGRWVGKQRAQYSLRQRGRPSQLTDARIAKLEQIGFNWGSAAIANAVIVANAAVAASLREAATEQLHQDPTMPGGLDVGRLKQQKMSGTFANAKTSPPPPTHLHQPLQLMRPPVDHHGHHINPHMHLPHFQQDPQQILMQQQQQQQNPHHAVHHHQQLQLHHHHLPNPHQQVPHHHHHHHVINVAGNGLEDPNAPLQYGQIGLPQNHHQQHGHTPAPTYYHDLNGNDGISTGAVHPSDASTNVGMRGLAYLDADAGGGGASGTSPPETRWPPMQHGQQEQHYHRQDQHQHQNHEVKDMDLSQQNHDISQEQQQPGQLEGNLEQDQLSEHDKQVQQHESLDAPGEGKTPSEGEDEQPQEPSNSTPGIIAPQEYDRYPMM